MVDSTPIFDIAIVGGGASGMMAAVAAASRLGPEAKIVVLEGGQRVGRKLLATGNGKCNFSNSNITAKDYNRPDFVRRIFHACSPKDIISRFSKSGLMIEEKEGRLYPASGTASSMVDILRLLLEEKEVQVYTDFKVLNINWEGTFRLFAPTGMVRAEKVILACGGKAAPQLGSDGSGYKLAESFGHNVTDLAPGLTALKCPVKDVKKLGLPALNGLHVSGTVSLYRQGELIDQEEGEILFREYGLSGIAIFQLSRYTGDLVLLDLMPQHSLPELFNILEARATNLAGRPVKEFFTGVFQRVVGCQIMKAVNLSSDDRDCGSLTKEELEALAGVIKGWAFPVDGPVGWQNAQVTLGGLDLSEFNPLTLESKIIPGLFGAGELLDVDGPCGGYNLQWAWSSGLLAGWSAARSLK